jgi:hypothetical protein
MKALPFVNAKRPTKWPRQTALSLTTACNWQY